MKSLLRNLFILFTIVLFTSQVFAQSAVVQEEKLVGKDSEFLVGFHTGIYDCNQDYAYPINLGLNLQYNYIPNVFEKFFFGGELGVFYSWNPEDGNSRTRNTTLANLTLYPGLKFNVSKKEFPEEVGSVAEAVSRKASIAAGFTVGIPLIKNGTGPYFNPDHGITGIGASILGDYEITNEFAIFASFSWINRDTDGFSWTTDREEKIPGNEFDQTFFGKLGIAFKLF
jgi:hypothetical protein